MALTLRLPVDLEGALEERCRLTGASKTGVVVVALRRYLAREGHEEFIAAALAGGDESEGLPAPGPKSPPASVVGPSRSGKVVGAPVLGGKEFKGPDWRGGK